MSESGIAQIFRDGPNQSVCLPEEFRLPGDRVRVRRVEGGILLEPIVTDIDAWFHELDQFADVPFMEDGRCQPPIIPAQCVSGDRFFIFSDRRSSRRTPLEARI